MEEGGILETAKALCLEAGLAAPLSFTRLAGGKNNRVFRISLFDGTTVVLKSYFYDPSDTRDRLAAEWSFLTYAWSRSVRAIPQPLGHEEAARAGLYSFLDGQKLDAGAITTRNVLDAADFVCAINASPREIAGLALGSEACLSLDQHVATIDRRVLRLAVIRPDTPHRERAETFIKKRLAPAWRRVRDVIEREVDRLGWSLTAAVASGDVIASPSDFGFHNVLMGADGVLRFLDFEYAGRDDPAKLVGDLYACPEIPTPQDTFDAFVDRLSSGLSLTTAAAIRARLLRDAYRVKWACIILNDFLPAGDARRAFAANDDYAQRCARQLEKADAKLTEIVA